MTNSTLLFRSLAIIILLVGTAHLFTYAVKDDQIQTSDQNKPLSISTINDSQEHSEHFYSGYVPGSNDITSTSNEGEYDLTGYWKVTYNSKDFKGSVLYEIKNEGSNFNAYTYRYEDENGNSQKAEGSKILIIRSLKGNLGGGIYKLEYEGQQYEVECQVEIIDESTMQVSYDYYGYSDVETWKKQIL